MDVIDIVVKDAQKKGIFLISPSGTTPNCATVPTLGPGNWPMNGFSKLGISILSLRPTNPGPGKKPVPLHHRPLGYSPAIGMWQTVRKSMAQRLRPDQPLARKGQRLFCGERSYHHPTTASKSGDVDWPEGSRPCKRRRCML